MPTVTWPDAHINNDETLRLPKENFNTSIAFHSHSVFTLFEVEM